MDKRKGLLAQQQQIIEQVIIKMIHQRLESIYLFRVLQDQVFQLPPPQQLQPQPLKHKVQDLDTVLHPQDQSLMSSSLS